MKIDTIILLITGIALVGNLNEVLAKAKGVTEIDQLRAHYISLEKALWQYVDERSDRNLQLKKVFDNNRIFVLEKIRKQFNVGKYFVLNRYYEWALLEQGLTDVNGLFEYFRSFLIKYSDGEYNERVTLDLIETVMKDKRLSIPAVLEMIENVMVKQTLYYRAMMDAKEQICATRQSAQQFLYSLYSDIAFTELKGFIMMQFSWMMLKIYDKGNFTHEAVLMREDFEKRTNRSQALLREIMKRADKTVWTCDPSKYQKGVTFDEVTRLLQGYIENEVDMNSDQTCRENCGYYSYAENHGCFKDMFCARQPRCSGKLLNCQFVDSDMWVCPAKSNSSRRYEYIEYESGRLLGKKTSCPRGTTKVDSWWRWLFWHCSYCLCFCDEQGIKSDRYFNLRETVSDVDKNMVVTGLRFRKHKRVFHIQIQEGELLPRGNINSTHWKPIDGYHIYDRRVLSGKDFHTLSWNNRAIDLDDVESDKPTQIVTGVRFRVLGTHLNLEVRLTEFDFESGKLIDPKATSFWKSNDNTDVSGEKRKQILLTNPDVSSRSYIKSLPTSNHNQYIEFTHTDLDKDAAQSTVPFIDIQDVISDPPVPLSGVGIYHKGRDQYGGFVAPKLITYDFSPYIHSPLTSDT